ncbi:hypothetical protein ACT43E_20795 (plasmid) [Acinetobacter baumannii]
MSDSKSWDSSGFGYLKPAEHVFTSKGKAAKPQDRATYSFSRTISDPSKQEVNKAATGKEIDARAAQIKARFEAQKAQEKQKGR